MTRQTVWSGTKPENCDLCSSAFHEFFVDGATRMGPWGCLCLSCHQSHGVGLGTGRGQKYQKTLSEEGTVWIKVSG